MLQVAEGVAIGFKLKSRAQSEEIDGWKHICGGVGLYRPDCEDASGRSRIRSVLVLRKHTDFPSECLEQSTVNVFKAPQVDGGTLCVGSRVFDLTAKREVGMGGCGSGDSGQV